MSRLLRSYIIPALVVALTGTGVSFAAAGGVPHFQHENTPASNQIVPADDQTTTEVESTESDQTDEEVTEQNEDADGPEENGSHGPVRFTEGCPEGTTNHGQFVSQSEDKQTAAHSPCGKPIHAVDKGASNHPDDNGAPEVEENDNEGVDHGQGEQHSNQDSNEHEDDEGESG